MQQESIQYYHRYFSLFHLSDYFGVIRDTQRNLDLFSFVDEHSQREEIVWNFQQFRPYVVMMNTRAKASLWLHEGKSAEAMHDIERGRDSAIETVQRSNRPERATRSIEVACQAESLEKVRASR